MAFCAYCGRKLEEGEICGCRQQIQVTPPVPQQEPQVAAQQISPQPVEQPTAQPIPPQPVEQPILQPIPPQPQQGFDQSVQYTQMAGQMQQQANQYTQAAGGFLKRLWQSFAVILRQPYTMGQAFINSADHQLGLGFICLQAVIVALFGTLMGVVSFGKLETQLNRYLGTDAFSFRNVGMEFPAIKAFFGTLALSLAFSALFFGLIFLADRILKNGTDAKKLVALASLRSVFVIVLAVIACVIGLVNPLYGVLVLGLGNLFGLLIVLVNVQDVTERSKNLKALIYLLVYMVFTAVFVFAVTKSFSLYLPKELAETLTKALDDFRKLDLTDLTSYF